MAITITAHGRKIDTVEMVERLNGLLERIGKARDDNDVRNFEYYSGIYDGYRASLADMGYSVIYNATGIVGIEKR